MRGARARRPRGAEEGEHLGHGTKALQKAESFVTSPAHWAYAHMLCNLTAGITRIMAWVETCPCHHQLARGETRHTRVRTYHSFASLDAEPTDVRFSDYEACPMKSRRGPEVAAGDLQVILDEAMAASSVEVLKSCAGLEEEQRTRVLADMRHGQHLLRYSLQLKLTSAQTLPFLLVGLSHHDSRKARACAPTALEQFNPDHHHHHRLSNKILGVGTPLRAQVEAFAVSNNSLSLESYPDLFHAVEPLKYIPLAERAVERLHAMGKQALMKAPHHSSDFFSMAIRRLQLQTSS